MTSQKIATDKNTKDSDAVAVAGSATAGAGAGVAVVAAASSQSPEIYQVVRNEDRVTGTVLFFFFFLPKRRHVVLSIKTILFDGLLFSLTTRRFVRENKQGNNGKEEFVV